MTGDQHVRKIKSRSCLDVLCTAAMLHVIKNCQDQLLLLLLLHPHYYYYYLSICLLAAFQGQIFFLFFFKGGKVPLVSALFLIPVTTDAV